MDGKEIWMGKIRMGRIDQVRSAKLERRRKKGRMSSVFLPFFLSLPFISVTVKILPLCFIPSEYGQRVAINYYILLFYLPRRCEQRFESRVNASKVQILIFIASLVLHPCLYEREINRSSRLIFHEEGYNICYSIRQTRNYEILMKSSKVKRWIWNVRFRTPRFLYCTLNSHKEF